MSMPATPSNPSPAGDDRNLVAADPALAVTFEDKMNAFWQRNRGAIFAVCGLVLLFIVGRGVWNYMARQKELEVQKAYSAAASAEQLKAFAAAHPNHALSGIAQLRLADEAYAAGRAADAVAGYDKAVAVLKDGPLAARALLGRAIAKVQAGKAAEGTSELKQLAGDAKQPSPLRAEAAYHLTSLAVEAGNAAEARTFADQVSQLEPMGVWAQRAMMLRAQLPAAPESAPAPDATAPVPSSAKQDSAVPAVELKLPGKK